MCLDLRLCVWCLDLCVCEHMHVKFFSERKQTEVNERETGNRLKVCVCVCVRVAASLVSAHSSPSCPAQWAAASVTDG